MAEVTQERQTGRQQTLTGVVVSDKMDKTVVVAVKSTIMDRLYRRYIKRTKRFHAHDEGNEYRKNDVVEIRACRPRSKTKRWEVIRLIDRPPEV